MASQSEDYITGEMRRGKGQGQGADCRGTSGPKERAPRTAQAAATSEHDARQHQNEARV